MRRDAARYAMKAAYWLFNHLPYGLVKRLTPFLIWVGLSFTGHLQKTARESLRLAFGHEKSEQEIDKICKDCFTNFSYGLFEMLYLSGHFEMMKDFISFEGKENLDAALAKGKGVMAVTAHFGSFPMMMMHMARLGYPVHVLMRKTRDPKIDAFLLQKRNETGLKTIYALPRKAAVMDTLKALRNNEIVFILMDQNFGSDGKVFVDFFGQKAATAPGPIVLAQRAGAPIVPLFIRREKDKKHKIEFLPEMELEKRADYDEMVFANVAKITTIIENMIRKYPHEWGWMHRRWKTRAPSQDTTKVGQEIGGNPDGNRQEN